MEKIDELSALPPGAPTKDASVHALAKAILNIVGDQAEIVRENENGKPVLLRAAVPARQSGEELIQLLLASCERFPTPIAMRRLYETELGYSSADGRSFMEMKASLHADF